MGSDGNRTPRETALDADFHAVGEFEYDDKGNIIEKDPPPQLSSE